MATFFVKHFLVPRDLTPPRSVGEAIQSLRGLARLSQVELARKLGVSRVSISAWERGDAEPSEGNLIRLAALFGVSVESLIAPSAAGHGYALSDEDVAKVPGLDAVLDRLPDHVHAVVWPFLGEMAQAGISREARDEAEVFLTRLSRGYLTPGYPSAGDATEIADALDAIRLLRELYQRRGVALVHHEPLVTDDPDAMTGREFVDQLSTRKRKPRAG